MKEGALMRVAIIGGGAAGLICACTLGEKKIDVTLFEKNDRVGKKLLSTGNGRCNMTNLGAMPEDYFDSAEFVAPAFQKYPPQSNVAFFEERGLYTRADGEGRVYPLSNQASSVLDCLRLECERLKVRFACSCDVKTVEKKGGSYVVNGKDAFDKVVFACGGRASVKDFNSYSLLAPFGHKATKTAPSLVRLVTDDKMTKQLKGIRAAVSMTLCSKGKKAATESGELLFSDFSLSGIVSMELSSFVSHLKLSGKNDFSVEVDFVPEMHFEKLLSILSDLAGRSGLKSENLLSGLMPKKIGICLLKKAGISPEIPMNALLQNQLRDITALCKKCVFKITDVGPYSQAQVTVGGINRNDFFETTLESKKHKGLYCCGEMLDVDGKCGGYNLQWAFSSGRLCGESIIRESRK